MAASEVAMTVLVRLSMNSAAATTRVSVRVVGAPQPVRAVRLRWDVTAGAQAVAVHPQRTRAERRAGPDAAGERSEVEVDPGVEQAPVGRPAAASALGRRRTRADKAQRDADVLAGTGIRTLRAKPVFTSPNVFAPDGFVQEEVDAEGRFREPEDAADKKLLTDIQEHGWHVVGIPDDVWGQRIVSAVVLRAGQVANPQNLPGLAGFTAAMLQEGTATRSSQQLADQIANLGATLNTGA